MGGRAAPACPGNGMILLAAGAVLLMMETATSAIQFDRRAPGGRVGNGRSVVKVRPGGYEFFSGGKASGRIRVMIGGKRREIGAGDVRRSEFFPGGVIYSLNIDGVDLDVLHGALKEVAYVAAFRTRGTPPPDVQIDLESTETPAVSPSGRLDLSGKGGFLAVSTGSAPPAPQVPGSPTPADPSYSTNSWDDLRAAVEAPYLKGFQVRTPSPAVDRAARFCQFLLDLGFDGRLHVSELFRWRDIWSRDLGTGLAPGSLVGGRFDAARISIQYDLARYKAANPRGLRITEDASQGGSAEGTAWLTRAVWRDYLLSGDRAFLAEAAGTLRPWVRAWIDRDADEDGLVIDVTEWMDHSRFFLFPDGALGLYSNALFADLMGTFSKIEKELGDETAAAARLDALRRKTARAINDVLWNESAGAYDNLSIFGRNDQRLSSAENALAVLAGVAPPDRARRALQTVRDRNWRKAGSVTIAPAMTHVDDKNDQNVRVWPWWNAVEARARFRTGDTAGAVHLLEKCAATLEDEHYPGLIEELLTPEGVTEGGHAFLSAAGTFLDALYEGLLGIEILEAGCARIRVSPHTPDWKAWEAAVPLPGGDLSVSFADGVLRIRVTDPRVKVVEAPASAIVEGATRADFSVSPDPSESVFSESKIQNPKSKISDPKPRRAALFSEPGIPRSSAAGLPKQTINAEALLTLDPARTPALVIAGNALPRRTKSAGDVQNE